MKKIGWELGRTHTHACRQMAAVHWCTPLIFQREIKQPPAQRRRGSTSPGLFDSATLKLCLLRQQRCEACMSVWSVLSGKNKSASLHPRIISSSLSQSPSASPFQPWVIVLFCNIRVCSYFCKKKKKKTTTAPSAPSSCITYAHTPPEP